MLDSFCKCSEHFFFLHKSHPLYYKYFPPALAVTVSLETAEQEYCHSKLSSSITDCSVETTCCMMWSYLIQRENDPQQNYASGGENLKLLLLFFRRKSLQMGITWRAFSRCHRTSAEATESSS